MNIMISYLLTTTLGLILFYLLYKLFLSRETFFKLNRFLLLGGIIMGLFTPLLTNFIPIEESTIPVVYLPTYGIQDTSNWIKKTIEANNQSFFSWSLLVSNIYILGFVFSMVLFIKGIIRIYHLKRYAKVTKYMNYALAHTAEVHSPFSFGNTIFISTQIIIPLNDLEKILLHEEAHVKQKHTRDVIFLELLKIIFWFNPIIYYYDRELRNIHEYLADKAVLDNTSTKQYGKLLIKQSVLGLKIKFANHFIYSQLKNRISMMVRKRSSKYSYSKYILIYPIAIVLISSIAIQSSCNISPQAEAEINPDTLFASLMDNFSEEYENPNSELKKSLDFYLNKDSLNDPTSAINRYNATYRKTTTQALIEAYGELYDDPNIDTSTHNFIEEHFAERLEKDSLFDIAEHMPSKEAIQFVAENTSLTKNDVEQIPMFPGCLNTGEVAQQTCSNQKLMTFISNKLKYPQTAKKNKTEGRVIISFIVDTDGSIKNAKIVRNIKDGCGAEALRIVNSMNDMPQKWTPGKKNGKNVAVRMVLPFSFSLS
ncbi:MAG: M56 family metallopeptidase [Aureispira sp.]|nr:M56 family metallopeptidase [Aureispira sp.]